MRQVIIALVVLVVGLSVASWLVGTPRAEDSPLDDAVTDAESRPPTALLGGATEGVPVGADLSPARPDHLVSVAPVSALVPDTISVATTIPIATTASTAPPAARPTEVDPPADPPPLAPAPAPSAGDAAAFLADLNALRSAAGISSLIPGAELDSLAQSWAETMAADGSLRHSQLIYDVIAGSWSAAAENIGYGPSASAIVDGLKASPGHLDNMLNPAYTSVGIGAVRVDDVLWTAHIFAG